MPGKPGSGGPVPKRSEARRRRNKDVMPVTAAPAGAPVVDAPKADPEWHPIAHEWFSSLACSGQSRFFESSDWATARLVAEAMSRLCRAEKMSAQLFQSVLAGTSSLLATEGDRRRLRMELQRESQVDTDELAAVAALDEYRTRLSST